MSAKIRIGFVLGLLWIGLSGCQVGEPYIEKSTTDDRVFLYSCLDNGLSLLVVEDPQADKMAAAMTVAAGSYQEPDDVPGLAHFCEHMLFLGTEPYPEPNGFMQFVETNGGRFNAMTRPEQTVYYFDVKTEHFDEAMARFSAFFDSPLFDARYVDKERHAVDSEFQGKLMSDGFRAMDAVGELYNPAHPASRFRAGNLTTLGGYAPEALREKLVAFHQKYYQPQAFYLVVVTPQNGAALKAQLEQRFSSLPADPNWVKPEISAPPILADSLGKHIHVQAVSATPNLYLEYLVTHKNRLQDELQLNFLMQLLGREAPGTLTDSLYTEQLVTRLSVGRSRIDDHHDSVEIELALTEHGLAELARVRSLIAAHIARLPSDWQDAAGWDQWQNYQDRLWLYSDNPDALDLALSLSLKLTEFPVQRVLRGGLSLAPEQFNEAKARAYWAQLVPSNLQEILMTRAGTFDREAKYTHTAYQVSPLLPLAPLAEPEHHSKLQLKAPKDFRVVFDAQMKEPKRLLGDSSESWWFFDATLKKPEVLSFVSMNSPLFFDSPRHLMMAELWMNLMSLENYILRDALSWNQSDYSVSMDLQGISLETHGFRDQHDATVALILERLLSVSPTEERFASAKQEMLYRLRHWYLRRPSDLARNALSVALTQPSWDVPVLVDALSDITREDWLAFRDQMRPQLQARIFVTGNVTEQQTSDWIKDWVSVIKPIKSSEGAARKLLLLSQSASYRMPPHPNAKTNLLLAYLQGPDNSLETMLNMELMAMVMHPVFYDALRTQKQLAYHLYIQLFPYFSWPALMFYIDSPQATSDELWREVHGFYDTEMARLSQMTMADWEPYRAALSHQLSQPATTLSETASRFWGEIQTGRLDFDRKKRAATQLAQWTPDSMATLLRQWGPQSAHQWMVITSAHQHVLPGLTEIAQVDALKSAPSAEWFDFQTRQRLTTGR
ncbi:MAG: insulinase family protein [Pseudomonadota bacterium]